MIARSFFTTIAGLIGLFLIWHIGVTISDVPHYILPAPIDVAKKLWQERVSLAHHAGITLIEIIVGMILGVLVGGITAIGMTVLPPLRRILYPAIIASQALPVFALAPMLVMWLGYGMTSKIAMTVLILYFPVCATLYHGLRRANPDWQDLAFVMNAHPLHRLMVLDIPAALPVLTSGLKIAAATAPIGAVIGEWVGSSGGLGYLMLNANARMKIDLMFAALLVLAMMAVLLFALISVFSNFLTRWDPQKE
jgi:putative hydroxymethylpyrimidine transport system permease protein